YHEVQVIDVNSLTAIDPPMLVTITNTMNLAINGVAHAVTAVGLFQVNLQRFEPNVRAELVEVFMDSFDATSLAHGNSASLNPHLLNAPPTIPQSVRNLSVGDPRGVTW